MFFFTFLNFFSKNFLNSLGFFKKRITKSSLLFGIVEYKVEYRSSHLLFFFLPLFINICQITGEIQKNFKGTEIISVVSVLTLVDEETGGNFVHTLPDSNDLYKVSTLNKWANFFIEELIEKLELYNSFKKITLSIKIKKMANV